MCVCWGRGEVGDGTGAAVFSGVSVIGGQSLGILCLSVSCQLAAPGSSSGGGGSGEAGSWWGEHRPSFWLSGVLRSKEKRVSGETSLPLPSSIQLLLLGK